MIVRILTLSFLLPVLISARVFTDDEGRQVEAELIGIRGENVVLSTATKTGQWPIAKLSAEDRAYVEVWKKDPPSTPTLRLRVWEREGIGSAGAFEEQGGFKLPKSIPLLREVEETAKYKHFEVDITNPSEVDAINPTMAYVLYIINPDGSVSSRDGSREIGNIVAGKRTTEATEGISFVRTKTTSTTLNISGGNLSAGASVDKKAERFGGTWVRIYAADGSIVGEIKDLSPPLEKLDPAWVGSDGSETFPLLEGFEALGELLKKLPKPPLPPRFPKPPFRK